MTPWMRTGRKMTALLDATPTLPAPACDWLRRIDDVVHDVIAAEAAANNACGGVLKGVAGYKTI